MFKVSYFYIFNRNFNDNLALSDFSVFSWSTWLSAIKAPGDLRCHISRVHRAVEVIFLARLPVTSRWVIRDSGPPGQRVPLWATSCPRKLYSIPPFRATNAPSVSQLLKGFSCCNQPIKPFLFRGIVLPAVSREEKGDSSPQSIYSTSEGRVTDLPFGTDLGLPSLQNCEK